MTGEAATIEFGWIAQFLAAGGGGAVIAYGVFKILGQNWIKHQFAKDLEHAKSAISFHAAKRMRLHDKEYEVFPEIWSRLSDAKASLQGALMEFRRMPDINNMEEEDFTDWLNGLDLECGEKDAVTKAPDRMSAFNRILDYKSLRKAEEDYLEFQTYLQKNRIFLSPEISTKFEEIRRYLRKAWAARTTDVRLGDAAARKDFLLEALDIFEKQVEPKMEEIESVIQGRLFPES